MNNGLEPNGRRALLADLYGTGMRQAGATNICEIMRAAIG